MQNNKKKLTIQILAILGFALTIKLAIIFYTANYQKYGLASFCSINDFIDCDGAARTTSAQFLGIPLAYWGMFFYLTVLFLTFVDKLKNCKFLKFLEVFKNPMSYITILGTIAFIVSMSLAGISIYRIHKLCILCVFTYIIDFIIALVASSGKLKNIIESVKTTVTDIIDGAKKYPKTTVILLLLSISFLAYSEISYNFIPHLKRMREIMKYKNMKVNPYKIHGNFLGAENADVTVEIYSDYVCPLCYIHNIMIHKAAKEFKNIKIIHYNFPFDKECNPYIQINMHPNACFMAKVAIASRKQNDYWGMSSLLYENQPKTINEVLKLTDKLNFDQNKFINDFNSTETQKELKKELNKAVKLNLDSTPTTYINGDQYIGIMQYKTLRDRLIEHGAKRK